MATVNPLANTLGSETWIPGTVESLLLINEVDTTLLPKPVAGT